jgi:hypothetical protein
VDKFDDLRSLPPHLLHPEDGKARAPLKDRIHLYNPVEGGEDSFCSRAHYVLVRKRSGSCRIVEEEFVSLFHLNTMEKSPLERYGLVD